MIQTPSSKEKRRFPRIPREAPVEIIKIAYPPLEGKGETGTVKNITDNGICFSSLVHYHPKTVLSLKIDLKGWQHYKKNVSSIVDNTSAIAPLSIVAEVIWSKKLPVDAGYEVGVKFIDIYEDDFIALKKLLDKLVAKAKNKKNDKG